MLFGKWAWPYLDKALAVAVAISVTEYATQRTGSSAFGVAAGIGAVLWVGLRPRGGTA